MKIALYSVWVPKANDPMIAVRVPVTMIETSTKMPSLIPATMVTVLREAAIEFPPILSRGRTRS